LGGYSSLSSDDVSGFFAFFEIPFSVFRALTGCLVTGFGLVTGVYSSSLDS